ncbi:MAG TPA: 3-hydroxyacyl-CoA dehydrogenase family protein [Alphaproteobacteria bacterium]
MTLRFADVAVLGAGTMGHGIAFVHALGGCRVRLQDVDPQVRARAPGMIRSAADILIEAGMLTGAAADAALQRIAMVERIAEAAAGADLIVEAVFEDPEVKRGVFAEIDKVARDDAVIASNISGLDIFPLVPKRRARRTMITHWYVPAYIIDLVDVVGSAETDPALLETMRGFLTGLGKRPILLKRFIVGYIANRLQEALSREIYRLLDDGYATAQDVDDSIRFALAERMALFGHLMKSDYAGLPLLQRILANKTYDPPPLRDRCDTLDRLVAAGRTGIMSGAGFFDYGGRPPAELLRERDRKLLRLKQALRKIDQPAG